MPGIPGACVSPSMISRPTALPESPSAGTRTSACTNTSKRIGVMRRKKPPNSSSSLTAAGSEEPSRLIFSEPTISMEKDSAGSWNTWDSDLRSTVAPFFSMKNTPSSSVMIFHLAPVMMVWTLAPARLGWPAAARSALSPTQADQAAGSVARQAAKAVFNGATQELGSSTSASGAEARPESDRARPALTVSPGMPSRLIDSICSTGVVLICSIALPSAKMP